MAYGLKRISPIDLKPSTAIGVAIPFSAPNVFSSVYTTKDQIRYNIINFMLTDPGERVFNPTFGAGLRARLFEQIELDSLEDIQQSIATQLNNYFPQIEVTDLTITPQPEYNSISIKFSYRLLRSNDTDEVSITVQSM